MVIADPRDASASKNPRLLPGDVEEGGRTNAGNDVEERAERPVTDLTDFQPVLFYFNLFCILYAWGEVDLIIHKGSNEMYSTFTIFLMSCHGHADSTIFPGYVA